MRWVRLEGNGTDDQYGTALECPDGVFAYVTGVGDVSQRTETISEDGKSSVHYPYGHNPGIPYVEFLRFCYVVHFEIGSPGVSRLVKGIVEYFPKCLFHFFLAIYREAFFQEVVERPYFIESADMVHMGMCQEDGIGRGDAGPEHLFPEIRSGIDDDTRSGIFYESGCPQSPVLRIRRSAYLAGASEHRNSG